jgi:hypothetical protein
VLVVVAACTVSVLDDVVASAEVDEPAAVLVVVAAVLVVVAACTVSVLDDVVASAEVDEPAAVLVVVAACTVSVLDDVVASADVDEPAAVESTVVAVSADASVDVTVAFGSVELVGSVDGTSNGVSTWARPVLDCGDVSSSVVEASSEGAACSSLLTVAGAAGAFDTGSGRGVPTESLTVGTSANGSVGLDAAAGVTRIWLCSSVTTGATCERPPRATCDAARFVATRVGVAARAAAGSGGSGRRLGTARIGAGIVGTASVGSAGFDGNARTDCRSAVAIGTTYRSSSTRRLSPAHQYRTPRMRNAVSP